MILNSKKTTILKIVKDYINSDLNEKPQPKGD